MSEYCHASQGGRFVNPKHIALMTDSLTNLYNGSFDEYDIRLLLLGVRETATKIYHNAKSSEKTPASITSGLSLLVDVADSLAHPEHKSQGRIKDYVKKTDLQIAKSFGVMKSHKLLEMDFGRKIIDIEIPPSIKQLSSFNLISAFILMLDQFFPFRIEVEKIAVHIAEIELCIFSILHFVQLPKLHNVDVSDQLNGGYLAIKSFQGKYSLNAGVIGSKAEDVLSPKGSSNKPFTFPVFMGNNNCVGKFQADVYNPKVIFACRDDNGQLYLRERVSTLEAST